MRGFIWACCSVLRRAVTPQTGGPHTGDMLKANRLKDKVFANRHLQTCQTGNTSLTRVATNCVSTIPADTLPRPPAPPRPTVQISSRVTVTDPSLWRRPISRQSSSERGPARGPAHLELALTAVRNEAINLTHANYPPGRQMAPVIHQALSIVALHHCGGSVIIRTCQ